MHDKPQNRHGRIGWKPHPGAEYKALVRLHLIDGTFELFRAHFAQRPTHLSPQGRDLKATVGVVLSMLSLLREKAEGATHLAVAFDNPIVSFRNDLFYGYKTDAGMDPVLRSQFDDVERGVAAAGITVWRMVEFEADDAMATAAVRWVDDVEQVRILTPDKDLGQVLEGKRIVQVDRIRRRELTEATLLADKGIGPKSLPDFLALVGDTADGIPGLEGWGEKSASAVLARYPKLEDIPADVKQWGLTVRSAEKLSRELEAHRAEATLYRTLATLRLDVPLKESLEDLRWTGVGPGFADWCAEVGLKLPELPPRPSSRPASAQ
jgi:5'-3' exonuclease